MEFVQMPHCNLWTTEAYCKTQSYIIIVINTEQFCKLNKPHPYMLHIIGQVTSS